VELHIRKITVAEFPIAMAMVKKTALELAENGDNVWLPYLHDKEVIEWCRLGVENGEYNFICNSDGEIVGLYRICLEDDVYWGELGKDANTGYLHSFLIDSKFKGMELGQKAMPLMEEKLRTEGFKFLRLDCKHENKKLCKYYEDAGFEFKGVVSVKESIKENDEDYFYNGSLYEKKL
jgi:ribosomal protein S18 acetylase RimI-like enzyme